MIYERDLRDQFTYHPPTSQERIDAHAAINDAAYHFATVVCNHVFLRDKQDTVITQIQVARMLANQFITQQYQVGNGEQ